MTDLWAAPTAAGPVDWQVRLPGSKSITNRLLVLAALADGRSVLRRPLRSRDTELMAAGLARLGVAVRSAPDGGWEVDGRESAGRAGAGPDPVSVDAGNAGTVARFLPAVAGLGIGDVHFDGDPRLRERPIGPLIGALRAIGADIDEGGRGGLPFTVRGRGGLAGGAVEVDASASSQFVSGVLLAAPRYARGIELRATGGVPSAPHLAMTVDTMRLFGAEVAAGPGHWRVQPGPLRPTVVEVEPDLSSAAPFLAAAAVTGGRVRIPGWPEKTTQPGGRLPELMEPFGLSAKHDGDGLAAQGSAHLEGGLDADLSDLSELVPVLAALAALADRPSRLRGLAHIRGHETDRLAALAEELGRLGAAVTELADGLQIRPAKLTGGRFETREDHRLVMAAAVVGLVVPQVVVENAATAAKTFPGFAQAWSALVAGEPG